MNQAEVIGLIAHQQPEDPAIVATDGTWCYRELDDAVRRTATAFRDRGVGPGDVVALFLKETGQHVICMLALGRVGALVLPGDWRGKAEERRRLVDQFHPRLAVVEQGSGTIADTTTIENNEAWRAGLVDCAPDDTSPANPARPFLINLSSGTTAEARATVLSHDQFQAWHRKSVDGFGVDGRQRYLSTLPLSFAAGRARVFLYLSFGGTVVLGPLVFAPDEFVEIVEERRITATLLMPTVLRRLLSMTAATKPWLPGLALLEVGADKLGADEKREVVERLTPNLYETYANSAIGQISCLRSGDMAGHADSVGRPNPHIDIQVVDGDGRPLPNGEVGELRCRGVGLATPFEGNAASSNHESITRDDWLYTGDLAALDGEGFLHLKGRAATVIIRRGVTIYPEEIEPVIADHPSVAEVAIVGTPDGEDGEAIVAFVVARGRLREADLRDHIRTNLTGYKHPQEIAFTDRLPRTASGKIDRGRLKSIADRGLPR